MAIAKDPDFVEGESEEFNMGFLGVNVVHLRVIADAAEKQVGDIVVGSDHDKDSISNVIGETIKSLASVFWLMVALSMLSARTQPPNKFPL